MTGNDHFKTLNRSELACAVRQEVDSANPDRRAFRELLERFESLTSAQDERLRGVDKLHEAIADLTNDLRSMTTMRNTAAQLVENLREERDLSVELSVRLQRELDDVQRPRKGPEGDPYRFGECSQRWGHSESQTTAKSKRDAIAELRKLFRKLTNEQSVDGYDLHSWHHTSTPEPSPQPRLGQIIETIVAVFKRRV